MSAQDRVLTALTGLLADERLRPPRVVARKVLDLLDSLDMLAAEPKPAKDAGRLVTLAKRRQEPPSWLAFVDRLDTSEVPIAVTRNRTSAALEALGLRPEDVRAVVIEQDWIRVYRWSDRTEVAQTMPVLEDKESA